MGIYSKGLPIFSLSSLHVNCQVLDNKELEFLPCNRLCDLCYWEVCLIVVRPRLNITQSIDHK